MPTPLDLAYLTALAAASPWLAWRAARTGRYRRDLAAKLLGRVPPLPPPTPGRPRLWFHGVSVGEVRLLRHRPRRGPPLLRRPADLRLAARLLLGRPPGARRRPPRPARLGRGRT